MRCRQKKEKRFYRLGLPLRSDSFKEEFHERLTNKRDCPFETVSLFVRHSNDLL